MTLPAVLAVIPARMQSRRFPGKLLYPYRGKPLLFHVWRGAQKSKLITKLIIATDSAEIASVAEAFGAEVFRSTAKHATGSDRAAEVARKVKASLVVNIQGDNFGLNGRALDPIIAAMQSNPRIPVATLVRRITEDSELFDSNCVKAALGDEKQVLWFSRMPIPYIQHATEQARSQQGKFWGHIGIYFFRARTLAQFAAWPRGYYEQTESLEQMRILERGGHIFAFPTRMRTVSIDSPADLDKME